MKKHAIAIGHAGGFFLAINGDLNKREYIINGKIKGLQTIKQYYKKVLNTIGHYSFDEYEWTDHEEAIVTPIDLTDKYYIHIDELWDPNLHRIDKYTGEILYTPENIMEGYSEVKEGITDLSEKVKQTKSLINIMKTKQEQKAKRSEAAIKGHETRKANQLKIQQQLAEKAKAKAKAPKPPKQTKRVVEVAEEIADQTAKQLKANKQEHWTDNITHEQAKAFNEKIEAIDKAYEQKIKNNQEVKDEAPRSQEASHNNNPVNHKQMKTENQNASASNDANNNVQPAKSFGRKTKYAVAKSTEVGVVVATDLVIGGLLLTSDIIFALAEGVAWTQAAAIKPLGLHPDATRRELMEQAMARGETRSKFVTALPKAAIALPIRAYNVAKQASKMRDDKTLVDVPNTIVVE